MVDGSDNNGSYRCTRISDNARSHHSLRTKSDRRQNGDEGLESRRMPSTSYILRLSRQGGYRGIDGKVVPVHNRQELPSNDCEQGLHIPLIVVELPSQQQLQSRVIFV